MIERFKNVKNTLDEKEYIIDIMIDEKFIPPHKSAAFTPYDCVLLVKDIEEMSIIEQNDFRDDDKLEKVEDKIKSSLSENDYYEIINTEYNDTSEDGDILVFIALESFEEYKSRW